MYVQTTTKTATYYELNTHYCMYATNRLAAKMNHRINANLSFPTTKCPSEKNGIDWIFRETSSIRIHHQTSFFAKILTHECVTHVKKLKFKTNHHMQMHTHAMIIQCKMEIPFVQRNSIKFEENSELIAKKRYRFVLVRVCGGRLDGVASERTQSHMCVALLGPA